MNMILNTDSYKASHFAQYPKGTTHVSSYIESRGGELSKDGVFFGLQLFLEKYLTRRITTYDIDEAEEFFLAHGEPFNRAGWERIVKVHDGRIPLRIEALPEGTRFTTRNVVAQVVNTDPELPWLTSYFETAILRAVWYGSTVASISAKFRRVIKEYMEETCDNLEKLPFMLNDFGARGVSSLESSEIGGLAHLISFAGTDNVVAVLAARKYFKEPMAGFSVPAAEHSTITSWGKNREVEAYRNMIEQFSKNKGTLISVVSDSYDLWNAIDNIWGDELKELVENSGSTLVVRPDSGDPTKVVVETINRLMAKFGYTVNSKGYKLLPDCVRVIQGDGIDVNSVVPILENMKVNKLSLDNIVFGMGGGLLQHPDRDTMKWAMKASAVKINGEWVDVFKNPATDSGKKSKPGILASTINHLGEMVTVRKELVLPEDNLLTTVFENGQILTRSTLSEIRERAQI